MSVKFEKLCFPEYPRGPIEQGGEPGCELASSRLFSLEDSGKPASFLGAQKTSPNEWGAANAGVPEETESRCSALGGRRARGAEDGKRNGRQKRESPPGMKCAGVQRQ